MKVGYVSEDVTNKNTAQISFRIDRGLKLRFDSKIAGEGRTSKEAIAALIRAYVESAAATNQASPPTPDLVLQNTPNQVPGVNKSDAATGVESHQSDLHILADRAAALMSKERVVALLCAASGLEFKAHAPKNVKTSTQKPHLPKRVRKVTGTGGRPGSSPPGVREAS